LAAKNQDGVNSIGNFLLKNRLERLLSSKFQTLFGCKMLGIDPKNLLSFLNAIADVQDGGRIQNGVHKKMINEFQENNCVLFVSIKN
jgi:hypothetical protein